MNRYRTSTPSTGAKRAAHRKRSTVAHGANEDETRNVGAADRENRRDDRREHDVIAARGIHVSVAQRRDGKRDTRLLGTTLVRRRLERAELARELLRAWRLV